MTETYQDKLNNFSRGKSFLKLRGGVIDVDEKELIRRAHFLQGLSMRRIARERRHFPSSQWRCFGLRDL